MKNNLAQRNMFQAIEQQARKLRSCTLAQLQASIRAGGQSGWEKAVDSFWETPFVIKTRTRGRCVPEWNSGGAVTYAEAMSLLKKGYTVFVEFANLRSATVSVMPGPGMRARLVGIHFMSLPGPNGQTESEFQPIVQCLFDMSGFREMNGLLDSLVLYPKTEDGHEMVTMPLSCRYPQNGRIEASVFGGPKTPCELFDIVGLTCRELSKKKI